MRASRRVVTVVFADLVGFTSLTERLDAEDVAAIQQAYFGKARESLVRHGGIVEKFIGDAVVGSFGVAHAHDDDAERQFARPSTSSQPWSGSPTRSASRGRPAGPCGGQHRRGADHGRRAAGWQLTGDVVNVAARLQSAATTGAVVVGAETALAVEQTIVLEAHGAGPPEGQGRPG